MCGFCSCGGVRPKQDANEIARRTKKRVAAPLVAISARSKASKVGAAVFRETPKTRPDDARSENAGIR